MSSESLLILSTFAAAFCICFCSVSPTEKMNSWESSYALGGQCKPIMVEKLNSLVKLVLTGSKYL